jgi:hypothetical protein
MSQANMVFTSVVAILGGVTFLVGFLYSMYKIAKRVEMAIGVDEEGRTLSERMHKVEHQLWPNGGSSLADQVSQIELSNQKIASEVGIMKDLVIAMVEPKPLKAVRAVGSKRKNS